MRQQVPFISIDRAHALIRQGSFSQSLLLNALNNRKRWLESGSPPEVVATVSAEILDYFGCYPEAERALDGYEVDEVLADLDEAVPGPEMKYRLWLALAFTQVSYRDEKYAETRRILSFCLRVLHAADPSEIRHYGTRARIQLAMGQALRQLGQYDSALVHFADSIRFSQSRFQQKTAPATAETQHSDELIPGRVAHDVFDASRKLAHWNIAKNLALGTGWIHYVTGRLTEATTSLNTAASLLRTTNDPIHTAYCELLIAGVARARHTNEPQLLRGVLTQMESAAKPLLKHPLFKNRARHELAVTYLYMNDLDNAEREIQRLNEQRSKAPGSGSRLKRWLSYSLILESRLLRKRGDAEGSKRRATEALDLAEAQGDDLLHCRVDALIALAEALRQRNRSPADLERASACLHEARDLSLLNPKTAAACTLHLAATYASRGQLDRARSEFGRWHWEYEPIVEHGFVKQLATDVSFLLWPRRETFVLEGTSLAFNQVRLERHLLGEVTHKGTRADQADALDIPMWRLKRLLKKHGRQALARPK